MFGLGAREAVLAALTEDGPSARGFGAPAGASVLAQHLGALVGCEIRVTGDTPATVDVPLPSVDERTLGRLEARLTAAAFALGWRVSPDAGPHRLRFVAGTQ
jgi:hypothetical protein